jgi:hypothetical protein
MGITVADTARHAAAVMRNFDFFGAPLAGIVSMHRDLGPADAVSVGMYLQTLMLALTARGLGTCVEVSVAGYHDVIRTELNIPPELTIITGLAVGYTDPDFPANKLRIGRDPVARHVVSSIIEYDRCRCLLASRTGRPSPVRNVPAGDFDLKWRTGSQSQRQLELCII